MYCGIGIALFYLQDKCLLHPSKLAPEYKFSFKSPFKELTIPVNNTDTISLIHFFPSNAIKKGIVIYFHGNAGNVEAYSKSANFFTDKGYEVLMSDYPGFGKSTGVITEQKLYQQAFQLYKLAQQYYQEDSIIVYGQSFGTGVAANLASYSKPRHLILESPYSSIPDLFRSYTYIYPVASMANFKLPTIEYVADVKAPIIIFHSPDDEVIPFSCAEKIKQSLKSTDKFITIEGVTHNNISASDAYNSEMNRLLQ